MKPFVTKMIALFAVLAIAVSCSKDDDPDKDVIIDDKNLSTCPADFNCEYLFFENSDLDTNLRIVKNGQFRVFSSNIHNTMEKILRIKTPMEGNSFELDKKDILAGKVVYNFICPYCDFVNMKPVDGYAKGVKVAASGTNKEAKWLLEYNIILQAEGDAAVKDTIYLKQYFEPGLTINN